MRPGQEDGEGGDVRRLGELADRLVVERALGLLLDGRPEISARRRRTWRTRSPSTPPGWIELAVMPNGPSSSARVLVKPTSPHFVVA